MLADLVALEPPRYLKLASHGMACVGNTVSMLPLLHFASDHQFVLGL
jgi:hypothetical protein